MRITDTLHQCGFASAIRSKDKNGFSDTDPQSYRLASRLGNAQFERHEIVPM
jgi:hypothetical protein